jgi:uncharacterized protein
MSQQLPLFPLNTVLFPNAPLSLHIFEERYRQMIGRCLEQSSPFGVVLLRSGSEVSADDPWVSQLREATDVEGEPPAGEAIPHPVGTTARISDSVRLEDGRYYLVAVGQRRFKLQYIVQRQPYLIASVSYLREDRSTATSEGAEKLRSLYARYWETMSIATGQPHEPEPLPEDPVELTYALAHRLRVDNGRKQRWLEAGPITRTRELLAALRAELVLLPNIGPAHQTGGGPWSWN